MPRTSFDFRQVDVFSGVALKGNPVAVFLDAARLDGSAMQAIANWTNLSETTFVLPPTDPGADYRLRIFTPRTELPFAGHPTLGSAHAVLESGLVPLRDGALVQQCGVGLVTVRSDGPGRLFLKVPPATLTPVSPEVQARVESALTCLLVGDVAVVDLGPRWLTGGLASELELLALEPDMTELAQLSRDLAITGVNLFARADGHLQVRSFAPAEGVAEDPVCGSGNAAVATLLGENGERHNYEAHQGHCVGRDGHAFIEYDTDGSIWLGGQTVTCISGTFTL